MNHPTTFPKSDLASPADAEGLDALRSACMSANIAVLTLLASKLVDDDLRFDLLQAHRDVTILTTTAERVVEGFSRAAERRLLPITPMEKAKADLANILEAKRKRVANG